MHVLVIPSWYFPPDSEDIRGRMFHQFTLSLRKKGIDARIFFAELNLNSPRTPKINYAIEDGVPTWRVDQMFVPKIHNAIIKAWINKYCRFLETYIEKEGRPDIIHAQSYLSGMVASALKNKTGIPIVMTERLSRFVSSEIPGRYKLFITDAFNNTNAVTCVSPGLKNYLQKYTTAKIEVVPNFYEPSIFYYDPSVTKEESFSWVSIGEPAGTKGLDILIEAFGQFRKLHPSVKTQLIMIDRIKEKESLLKLARNYNVAEDIIWKGLISQAQLADILRKSHVLISASRLETFGKAILEAQACGLPVIATKTDGALYILASSGQGMLIEKNDPDALSSAMDNMFGNYLTYDPNQIVTSVASRFSEDQVLDQWQEIYHRVIA